MSSTHWTEGANDTLTRGMAQQRPIPVKRLARLTWSKGNIHVDMGSSPMMGVTSYDVILNEVYIKSQLNIILLSRPLGATHCCSSLHDHIYKVPAHYCIMTWPLGATLVEVFMSIRQLQVPGCCKHDNPALGGYIIWNIQLWLVTEMNNLDFFKVATFILKQVLSYHYVLLLRLGGYR